MVSPPTEIGGVYDTVGSYRSSSRVLTTLISWESEAGLLAQMFAKGLKPVFNVLKLQSGLSKRLTFPL